MKQEPAQQRQLEAELEEAKKRVGHLSEAIQHRDMIGQAKGILMERHRITENAAFDLLVLASQHTNIKLHELAGQLASTGEAAGLETAVLVSR